MSSEKRSSLISSEDVCRDLNDPDVEAHNYYTLKTKKSLPKDTEIFVNGKTYMRIFLNRENTTGNGYHHFGWYDVPMEYYKAEAYEIEYWNDDEFLNLLHDKLKLRKLEKENNRLRKIIKELQNMEPKHKKRKTKN